MNLFEPLSSLFRGELNGLESHSVLFDRGFQSKLIKSLSDDCDVEIRHDNLSLFCLAFLAVTKSTECLLKHPEKFLYSSDYTNYVLKITDRVTVSQVESYLAAERLGIVVPNSPENTEEETKSDEMVDVDDFVKEEIEGPGLMSRQRYNS